MDNLSWKQMAIFFIVIGIIFLWAFRSVFGDDLFYGIFYIIGVIIVYIVCWSIFSVIGSIFKKKK
jgi:hypothetical protein